MNAQHTPGPLTIRVGANGDVGIIAPGVADSPHNIGGVLVAECFADIRRADEGANAEALANATLFAAAPDLLIALAKIVKYADSEPDGGTTVEMHRANVERARAAIAKAAGSAS